MQAVVISLIFLLIVAVGVAVWAFLSLKMLKNDHQNLLAQKQHFDVGGTEASKQLADTREALSSVEARLSERDSTIEEYKSRIRQKDIELDKAKAQVNTFALQQAAMTEREKSFGEKLAILQDGKEAMRKEFESLAGEILERKHKTIKSEHEASLSNLLKPLDTELRSFRSKIENLHTEETKQRVELKSELKQLQELNREITEKAEKLTTALEGDKKFQGSWGEFILEAILDRSGFREGYEYHRERTYKTEEGLLRPDVVVNLPQNRHLIIDAKTSLNAYGRYLEAKDDQTRAQELAAHVKAVGNHIDVLASRNYDEIPALKSPEVVILFIPIESAYIEALNFDHSIFDRAVEKNLLIATPSTLLSSLKIVSQLWRFEDQNKNTSELVVRAGKVHAKLIGFLDTFEKIDKQMVNLRAAYDTAYGQLYRGKGNLISQAATFKKLGVSVKKDLPPELIEKSELGLNEETVSVPLEGPVTG